MTLQPDDDTEIEKDLLFRETEDSGFMTGI